MKISVIITVYNAEKYLDRCIESLKNQTYKNLEFVFVNDGSTDKSLDIINKFQEDDSRVLCIDKEKNQGISSARNTALDRLTGDYFTFHDADDYIEPYTYEKFYNKIVEDNSDLVICDYYRKSIDDNYCNYVKVLDTDHKDILKDLKKEFLTKQLNGFTWNKLYKTSIIKSNNMKFDSIMKFIEDLYFNLDVIDNINSVSYIEEALCYYIVVSDSAITKVDETLLYTVKSVYDKKITLIKKWGLDTKENYREINNTFLQVPCVLCKIFSVKKIKFSERMLKIRGILNDSYDFIKSRDINYKDVNMKIKFNVYYLIGNKPILVYLYVRLMNLLKV